MLIEKAKETVRKPDRYCDINWTGYQDDLRIARKLLIDMYLDTASYSNGITKNRLLANYEVRDMKIIDKELVGYGFKEANDEESN